MTYRAATIDAQGAPDLQALARLCGEQYAKSIVSE